MSRLLALLLLAGCPGKHAATPAPEAAPDAAAEPVVDEEALEQERTAAIEHAMNALAPVGNQCWALAAVDDYQLAGRASFLIEVGDDGASTVTVEEDTVDDPTLIDCLDAVLAQYAWPEVMHGQATLIPFAFTAPHGQNVIDRQLLPVVTNGARVLLDSRNTGNAAASMFEVVVGEGVATTASERTEVWIDLATLDAVYLPPKAARAPAAGTYVVVSVPGGDEAATRRAGVLPAGPAELKDKKRPKAVPAPVQGAFTAPRPGVGTVTILVEESRTKGKALAASILDIQAGAAIPAHVHDASTELLYVLSGSGTMIVDGVTLPITPTTVVQVPAGIEHSFTATEATRVLQFYTPAGPEQRFKS